MTKMMTCEQCGAECLALRRRKLCGVCQAHRDLRRYPQGFSRKCDQCGEQFWPFRTTHRTCWACLAPAQGEYPECSQCGLRHRPAPGFEGTDRACTACVQSSAKAQKRYFNSLVRLIRERSKSMV